MKRINLAVNGMLLALAWNSCGFCGVPAAFGNGFPGTGTAMVLQIHMPGRDAFCRTPAGALQCVAARCDRLAFSLESGDPGGLYAGGGFVLPAFLQIPVSARRGIQPVQWDRLLPV